MLARRSVAVSLVSASLSSIATRMHEGQLAAGIEGTVAIDGATTTFHLRGSGLSPEQLSTCASDLEALVEDDPTVRVSPTADALMLVFSTA